MQPIAKRLNITRNVGWHTYPRTLATLLTGNDENAKPAQELMRPANAGFTMNLYAQALTFLKHATHLRLVEMIRPKEGEDSVQLRPHAKEAESVSACERPIGIEPTPEPWQGSRS
jgi:hypothetical protein